MITDAFSILMVIALGSLAGTGMGLILGYLAEMQKRESSASARNNKIITVIWVIVCSILCIAVLAYFSLVIIKF